MDIILISLISAAGSLILLSKIFGFHRIIRFQVIVDLLLTVGLPILFLGTFSGMAVAFLAGVFVSVFLHFSKHLV